MNSIEAIIFMKVIQFRVTLSVKREMSFGCLFLHLVNVNWFIRTEKSLNNEKTNLSFSFSFKSNKNPI